MKVIPHLGFDGTCEEAFRFYESALGGKIEMMLKLGESPMADQATAETKDRIMHAALSVGDQMIMGADTPGSMYKPMQGFCTNLSIDDEAEAERVFKNLSDGASVQMPIQETFWAKRFGMLTDKFGTPWMVNCSKPMGG